MQAVILEEKGRIQLRNIDLEEPLGDKDIRVKPQCVGICGSDIHYFREGHIGNFIVNEPMVLGHEASGIVVETGANVHHLKVGDRVCMEPGIPNFESAETLKGMYNLDPDVKFWATPPVHGCLRESVVHPACLSFALPDSVSFREGALVEPVAIGVYAVEKSNIKPGDTALVIGAGTIGIVTALAAEAAGCSRVIITDVNKEKLAFVNAHYSSKISTIDLSETTLSEALNTFGFGKVDIVFEASGSASAYEGIVDFLKPGGKIVMIGMPSGPVLFDVVAMQVKEISTVSIFRYVNIFPKVVDMIASGKLDVTPLITKTFGFSTAVEAFKYAASLPSKDVKIMIDMNV